MNTTRTLFVTITAAALAMPISIAGTTAAQAATLSPQTVEMLQHMVAEEKLAHDVYTVLGDTFDVPTFDNIARAESRHQSSVRTLLSRYGITDPTRGDAPGEFDDPQLQSMYDRLITQGKASVTEAARVGITIERIDIADLDQALGTSTPADVERVLQSLRTGSERHLAAFTRLEANPTATHAQDGSGMQQGQQGHQGGNAGRGHGWRR